MTIAGGQPGPNYSVIAGGTNNTATGSYSVARRGFRLRLRLAWRMLRHGV